ncbi:hypothetical protein D3C86_1683590 [compost metagenome]
MASFSFFVTREAEDELQWLYEDQSEGAKLDALGNYDFGSDLDRAMTSSTSYGNSTFCSLLGKKNSGPHIYQ